MVIKMIKFAVILMLFGVALSLPTNSSIKDVGPRIIGGDLTDISRNPWQLVLLYHGQHFCGAVEIHPKWALTAAHCLTGAEVDYLSIRAGSSTKYIGGQVVDVVQIIKHPDFNRRTVDYDFALLELAQPITVLLASPIALPEPTLEILPGETAIITGWGTESPEGLPTQILRIVEVPVVGTRECQTAHPHNTITARMFCAGDMINGGRDACRGDAGGPVVVNGVLAGLVSWGSGCGEPGRPGVHAKVASVVEWIYAVSGI